MNDLKMKYADADQYVYQHTSDDAGRPGVVHELLKANPQWTDQQRNDLVMSMWTHSNHTTSVTQHWLACFDYLTHSDECDKQIKGSEDENWMPLEVPACADDELHEYEHITVYRGGSSPQGLSWTTDWDIAVKFAKRNSMDFFGGDSEQSTIWQATVNKADILFLNNSRQECEVVIDYTKVDIGAIDVVKARWTAAYCAGEQVPQQAIDRYNLTQYESQRQEAQDDYQM